MATTQWTEGSLLRACRQTLLRPDTTVVREELDSRKLCARTTWKVNGNNKPYDVHVVLDHTMSGDVESMLHELVHVVLANHFTPFTADLEEAMVAGLEEHLFRRVRKSPYMMRAWRGLIAVKLQAE